nr:autotransporter assembly complex family protein [Kordiimonas marina]
MQLQQIRVLAMLAGLWAVFAVPAAPAYAANAATMDGPRYRLQFTLTLLSDENTLGALLRSSSRLYEKRDDPVVSLSRLDSRISADLDSFDRVLRSEGYYAAALDSRLAREEGRIEVEIVVHPGPRYHIKSVTASIDEGGGPDLDPALKLALKVGAPARAEDIVGAEQGLVTYLTNKGYPFADAGDRKVIVDHSDQSVSVSYHLHAGPKAIFGAVRYKGLEKTKAGYLDEFVPWKTGTLYSQLDTDEFRKRMASSGLFRMVIVAPDATEAQVTKASEKTGEKAGDKDSEKAGEKAPVPVPLLVQLSEAPRRAVEIGAGYSTGEGFEAEASWRTRNLWGAGESLRLGAAFGEAEQAIKVNFRKPHFRRFDQTLTAYSRVGRENTPAYVSHLAEAGGSIERKLTPHLTAAVGTGVKWTRVFETDKSAAFLLLQAPLGLTWDTTRDLLDPKFGVRANLRLKPSYSMVDERFGFLNAELNASGYYSFMKDDRLTLALRGRVGSIWGASLYRLPVSERFFAGGGGSVRGYSYQALGEINPDGTPVGGLSVAEISFETRLKVSDTIGIVPFIDGGNVYQKRLATLSGFRWGAGVGVRYYTSVAPVRLDVAMPLNRRDGDPKFAIYISLGQSF